MTIPVTFRLLVTVAVASVASLQFGYHLAELNAPQSVITCEGLDPTISDCIPMTAQQVGLVNGMNAVGGMIGAFFSGSLADKFGRRRVSFLNCLLFISGSLLMVASHSVSKLCFGRFLAGVGSGSGIVVTPMYISEISPLTLRGVFGTMNQVFVNGGILLAQLLGLAYSNEFEWRTILWAGACLGSLNAALLPLCVESPKWLALNCKVNEAHASLKLLRRSGNGLSIEEEIAQWAADSGTTGSSTVASSLENRGLLDPSLSANSSTDKVGYKEFISSPAYRRTLLAVVGVMVIQQLSGVNSIIFYGVSILSETLPTMSRVINCFISLLNLLTTVLVAPAIDKYGRRPLLFMSITGMASTAALLSIGLSFGWGILASVSATLFAMSFAIGLGPIPFLIISELTVAPAAGVSQSVGTTANWISTFIVGYFFPIFKSWMGDGVFFVFTLTGVLSFIYVNRYVPETKGKASARQVWQQF